MPQQYMTFVFIGLMVVMFWWMSRSSKKMREKVAQEREEAAQVGNNVVTTAGFFGTIVDIDGDAVTLQSPSGDETVWLRSAISAVADLPLASEDESFLDEAEEEYASIESDSAESSDGSEDGTTRN